MTQLSANLSLLFTENEFIDRFKEAKNNGSLLPVTELVDKYYGEVQGLGGNRWDTSSLIKRFRK